VFNSLQGQTISSEEAKNIESTVESTVQVRTKVLDLKYLQYFANTDNQMLFNDPIALLDSLIQLSKIAGQALKHDVDNFDMKKEAQHFK